MKVTVFVIYIGLSFVIVMGIAVSTFTANGMAFVTNEPVLFVSMSR
jgi:hypothetical protein